MGQPVRIVAKRSFFSDDGGAGVIRYEIDRSLSGTGHQNYDATSFGKHTKVERPTDTLAKRLMALPGVTAVHIFSNLITVNLEAGTDDAALDETLRDLFIHYLPGVEPSPV